MRLLVKAAVLLAAVVPAKAAEQPAHAAKKRKLGPRVTVEATAYTPCSSGSRMADGHSTYFGAVASNTHRMHTLLRFDRLLHGRRYFRVRDRIGSGSQLDIWMASCSDGIAFGRRTIGYRVVRP